MNTAKLIKAAPTSMLVAFLGYSAVTLQPALPDTTKEQQALEQALARG